MQLFVFVTKYSETFIGLGTIEVESSGPALRKRTYVSVSSSGMVRGMITRSGRTSSITSTERALPYNTRIQVGKIKKAGCCTIYHLVTGEKILTYKHT